MTQEWKFGMLVVSAVALLLSVLRQDYSFDYFRSHFVGVTQ